MLIPKPNKIELESTSLQNLHSSFTDAVSSGFPNANVSSLKRIFDASVADGGSATDADRKSTVDQVFRDLLVGHIIAGDPQHIGPFIDYAIAACRLDLATAALPVVLMSDVLDVLSLQQCEQIFGYVEDNVAVWREDWMFAACKNNLLRMCNDLLRRLSRSQNTVFCGRILLFLAMFFPFSERSGLNVVSEFNLENLTEFEADGVGGGAVTADAAMDAQVDGSDADGKRAEIDTAAAAAAVKIDHTLYCKFWALQDFFRNPNQCYNKTQWEKFASHASSVLAAFTSFKLEESRDSAAAKADAAATVGMDVDMEDDVRQSQHFFAKFLTNPKLLALQLSDSKFRRSVLVQFLILFQYLRSTVKFKAETFSLTPAQSDYIRDTDLTVYRLLDETPPNGQKFAATVRHMLDREQMWNNWKNDGCKEFSRPTVGAADETPAVAAPPTVVVTKLSAAAEAKKRRAERRLGDLVHDSIAQKRFYMGSPELTRLWNICPDNLQACRGADRNFLPSIETYLENPKDKTDPSFEWRALRLLARQSPHFFSLTQTPNKVSDYLEGVRKKIHESKSKANSSAVAAAAAAAAATTTVTTANALTSTSGGVSTNNGTAANKPVAAAVVSTSEIVDVVEPAAVDESSMPSGGTTAADEDDHNTHRIAVVTAEQMAQVASIINNAWRKVGAKIGYTPDVLQFIDDKPRLTIVEKCLDMLRIWFDEDEDATLDNLAYMLEGLELVAAAEAIKRIQEPADKMEDISE